MPRGMIWEIVAGSFGIAAAILLVGGWLIIHLRRDQQHFRLMQTALDKGITSMPGLIPGWLLSLRQGTLALILGIGVAISGVALMAAASNIDGLPSAALIQEDQPPADSPPPPPVYRDPQMHGAPRNNNDQGPQFGPEGHPQQHPPFNPAMERWHRIETQKLIGEIAACAGAILALLGIVRIAFSRIERKYATELAGPAPTQSQP